MCSNGQESSINCQDVNGVCHVHEMLNAYERCCHFIHQFSQ